MKFVAMRGSLAAFWACLLACCSFQTVVGAASPNSQSSQTALIGEFTRPHRPQQVQPFSSLYTPAATWLQGTIKTGPLRTSNTYNWGDLAIAATVLTSVAVIVVAGIWWRRSHRPGSSASKDEACTLSVAFNVTNNSLDDLKAVIISATTVSCQPSKEGIMSSFVGRSAVDSRIVVCRWTSLESDGISNHLSQMLVKFGTLLGNGGGSVDVVGPPQELAKLMGNKDLSDWGCGFFELQNYTGSDAKFARVPLPVLFRCFFNSRPPQLADETEGFQDLVSKASVPDKSGFGMTVGTDAETGRVVLNCEYDSAASVLESSLAPMLATASASGNLLAVEAHCPLQGLDVLAPTFGRLGCKFYFPMDADTCALQSCSSIHDLGPSPAGQATEVHDRSLAGMLSASASKVGDQISARFSRGSKARLAVEEQTLNFREKAKNFFIQEMNNTASAVLRAIDEEEATMLLEFNRACEASFPPVAVLLAGITSPAILAFSYYVHAIQLFALFLPVLVGTVWAAVTDWGSECDIPSLHAWNWSALIVAAVLVYGHLSLVFQISAGQRVLKQKTDEISGRLAHNAADGETGMSDIQEYFVGSTVLVQEALLLEDAVMKSVARAIVGPCTMLWIILVMWNFVIVIGWTFVPGQISFYAGPGATHTGYCAAWASVFTARIVCITTPLFFFLNIVHVVHWSAVTAVNSEGVSSKVLQHGKDFDRRYTGVPVVEILLKAFLLRGSYDVYPARLTVALGEALRLSKERDDLESQLDDVTSRIKHARSARKSMQNAATQAGESIEENLNNLEKVTDDDAAAWKQRGIALSQAAESRVSCAIEPNTAELERIAQYLTDTANQISNSEAYQGALAKAQQTAQDVQAVACEGMSHVQNIDAQAAWAEATQQAQQSLSHVQGIDAQAALADATQQAQQSSHFRNLISHVSSK